jgi:hypothetical protein
MLQDHSYFTIMPSKIAEPSIQNGHLYPVEYQFDYELPSHQIYIFTLKNIENPHSVENILSLMELTEGGNRLAT